MQGWFAHSFHFLPNNQTLPIFVGTHFTDSIRIFLENIIVYYPWYFSNKSIGCRDLNTLMYCKSLGLNAYFSRCLTLTLPRRTQEEAKQATKVFLVGIPNEMLKFIPNDLLNDALQVHQQLVFINDLVYENIEKVTLNLLETYKTQAKLIITCALHCASPAIAMGIPVVLIARSEENLQRFSALNGIVPIYTLEDLEKGRVDFAPKPLDIESLKQDMLENLRLSIKEAMGESVDKEALQTIRQRIADFTPKMIESQNTDSKLCGGQNRELVENTWKEDFAYDLEFKQRAQILLDLLSKEARKSLKSVLDLGCGIQYFKEVLAENGLNPDYCGVDLYPQKPDNILCDFNQGEFPIFSQNQFDLIVCAGVFEYIHDLPSFVSKICALQPKYILCSYNFVNVGGDNKIWVKRLKQEELFDLFLQQDYCLNTYKTHKRSLPTGYFLFCKKELMGVICGGF